MQSPGLFSAYFEIILLFLPVVNLQIKALTLNEYQQHALDTAIYPDERRIIYPTLGLTGEAGEVADKV